MSCYAYMYHVCETCHELSFTDCSTITIGTLLLPNTHYSAHLTDKFGNHYVKDITTNGTGGFVLNDTGLVAGFFNKWMGDVELKVTLVPNSTNYVDLNISGTNKKCIIISIIE